MPAKSSCESLAPIALAVLIGLADDTAMAQSIEGTATCRERITSPGNPPIAFLVDDTTLFGSDTAVPVIAHGNPTTVLILLHGVGASQPGADRPLVGTYWKATVLAEKHVGGAPARDAHLVFESDGRVSGSDGCNRLMGSYEVKGGAITFGQMGGTLMACIESQGIERAFRDAVKSAARFTIDGDRLRLFDSSGRQVAQFTGQPQATGSPARLEGTSWRLVKFQGGDDTTLTPDDRAKYTIEFGAGGRLTARVDCNRGRGSWRSNGPHGLQFGPLALTRARCPEGSLHDHIVKQWPNIRSYVVRDGRLFLSLMADGGIYEFEPVQK